MGRPKGFEREDVLQKAIQVFWKKGYADTSVQDLEKATGVNKSGLYSEFNDKQDLFMACLEYYFSQSQAVPVLTQEPPGWKNIENFLFMGQTCKGRKGCFGVNTIRELQILPPKAKTLLTESTEAIKKELVRNLIAENVAAPEAIADIIMTFNSGNCLAQNSDNPDAATERARAFLDILRQPPKSGAHMATW